jgi:hypothetical protein
LPFAQRRRGTGALSVREVDEVSFLLAVIWFCKR